MDKQRYENIKRYLQREKLHEDEIVTIEKQAKGIEIKSDTLYKRRDGKLVKILKEDEIDSIMFMTHNHETGAHFGVDATYNKIAERYYWKGMYKDIKRYVRYCDACQRRGQKGGKGNLYPIKVGESFERIGIDFVGPLERTKKGNKYILVVTDYLTKWPEAKAMKEATAKNVIEFIYEEIICRHGCPRVILSDRGTHFRNELVDGLCEKFEIKHKLSSPYHPQTNGLVERFNRTLCEALAKVSEKENEWDKYIKSVLFAYRTNKHNTTKRTPFFMVYGREAILPIDDINEDGEISEKESLLKRVYEIINLNEKRKEVLETIKRSQEKQKERHDEKIIEDKFEIGDKVLLKDTAKEKQWSGKLSQKWKGPYYVHQIIGKGAYKLRDMDGRVLKATRNIKHLKRYFDQRDLTTRDYI
jgi:hypothetical protein